ncbi:hypothetical protein JW848_02800, partial [Candidatus Bipolaricaulota bacterium]|nr:hypothetical protein [Candidatus Bipolaricaulota bacterium]
ATAAGTYRLRVTDHNTCWDDSNEIVVTSVPDPVVGISSGETELNCNNSHQIQLTATVTAGTGEPDFTYEWYKAGVASPVATHSGVSLRTDTYTAGLAGTYTVKVIDNNLCDDVSDGSVTLTDVPDPVVGISSGETELNCNNSHQIQLTATVTVGTGEPDFTYEWYKAGVALPVATHTGVGLRTDTYTAGSAGTYTVKVIDNNLCDDVSDGSVTLTHVPDPVVSIVSEVYDHCSGGVTFTASASLGKLPYMYAWDVDGDGYDDGIGATLSIGPSAYGTSGSVGVRVVDANGCDATRTEDYSINTKVEAKIELVSLDQCTGFVELLGTATGGTGAGSYGFIFGDLPAGVTDHGDGTASGTVVPGIHSGIYVTATDANGCWDSSNLLGFERDNYAPILQIEKVVLPPFDEEVVLVGDIINYEITVRNAGNVPLTDVHIVDGLLGMDEVVSLLDVGESETLSGSHSAGAQAFVGPICNIVMATAVDICGESVGPVSARTCTAANRPPVAYDQELETCQVGSEQNPGGEWLPFTITATDPDIDPTMSSTHPRFHSLTFPEDGLTAVYGSVSGNLGDVRYTGDGMAYVNLTYVSPIGFVGEDVITYVVEDPYGEQDVGTITILVLECEPAGYGGSVPLVVINEVAWTGTEASGEDEWIELYNTRAAGDRQTAINLEGWTLAWCARRTALAELVGGTVASHRAWLRSLTLQELVADCETREVLCHQVPLSGLLPGSGYYLLERQENDTVSDLDADLVYTPIAGDARLLDDLRGEEIYLFDASGELESSANTDYPTDLAGTVTRWIGWPAGALDTTEFASMELSDPILFDLSAPLDEDSYWSTNHGIFIYGVDAAFDLLTATARYINEALILRLLLGGNAPDPIEVIGGKAALVSVVLRQTAVEAEGIPQSILFAMDPLPAGLGGSICPTFCIAVDEPRLGISVLLTQILENVAPIIVREAYSDNTCLVTVDVSNLDPGDYQLFVTMGDGVVHGIPIRVIEEEAI